MFKSLSLSILTLSLTVTSLATAEDYCEAARKKPASCNFKDLTETQILNSQFLTDAVANKLTQLEISERQQGRDLKVVILARQGTNLEKLGVIKNTDEQGRLRTLDQLIKQAYPLYGSPFDEAPNRDAAFQYIKSQIDPRSSIKYSHVGIAIKNHPQTEEGGYWAVQQLLWGCQDNFSVIHDNGLDFFFTDHMADYGAEIMIPSQQIQDRLEQIVLDTKAKSEFKKYKMNYNAAAKYTALEEQNSNGWVLEMIAAASRPSGEIRDRAQAINVLKQTGYLPSILMPQGIYQLATLPGVSLFLPSTMCFSNQQYFANFGVGEIVTALSVENYLRNTNNLLQTVEVRSDKIFQETDAEKAAKAQPRQGK